MSRKPIVGSDTNTWGTVLNDYLLAGHNIDGSNKNTDTVVNVKDDAYGAKGDSTTDDTSALQAALTAGAGKTVFLPPPGATNYYKTSASLVPVSGTRIVGSGYWDRNSSPTPAVKIACTANVPVFDLGSANNITFQGLGLQGTANAGSKGINSATLGGVVIRECFFDTFGDSAIVIGSSSADCVISDVFVQSSLLVRTGRGAYIGAVDVSGSDHYLSNVVATCSFSTGTGQAVDGWCSGIVMRAPNSSMVACIGHLSEVGIVIASTADETKMLSCRADLNQKNGFVCASQNSSFVGNMAYRNSRNADNTAAGFLVTNAVNSFVGNMIIEDTGAVRTSTGFDDTPAFGLGVDFGNIYVGNKSRNLRGNLYNPTGSTVPMFVNGARSGASTQTPGAVATVNIAHGLSIIPSNFFVQAGETNSRGAPSMYVTADATNVILNFSANLTAATSYTWRWRAEL